LLIALLGFVFQGKPQVWAAPQVVSHLAFLTGIVGQEWLNVVYWTLALELQFYLLMSVLFPALARPSLPIIVVICVASIALAVIQGPSRIWITPYLPVFVAGLLAFWLHRGLIAPVTYGVLLAITGIGTNLLHQDTSVGIAAVATSAIIAAVRMPHIRAAAFLG